MALISKGFTFTAGNNIVASEHNTNFDTIYNDYNGNITNVNISASAGIVDTKLAQISTAEKVDGTALTDLADTPSGAGEFPIANIPSIDEDNMVSDSDTQVPTQQSVKAYADAINIVPDKARVNGWVKFDGTGATGAKAVDDSFNVTGVSKSSTGIYVVTWDTDFADANYCIQATAFTTSTGHVGSVQAQSAGTCTVGFGIFPNGAASDPTTAVYISAIGAQ